MHVVPERSSFVTLPPASAVTDLPTPQGPEPGQRLEQAPCTPLLPLMSRRRAWTFFGVRRFVKVLVITAKIQSRVIHQWGARHTHRQSFVAYIKIEGGAIWYCHYSVSCLPKIELVCIGLGCHKLALSSVLCLPATGLRSGEWLPDLSQRMRASRGQRRRSTVKLTVYSHVAMKCELYKAVFSSVQFR